MAYTVSAFSIPQWGDSFLYQSTVWHKTTYIILGERCVQGIVHPLPVPLLHHPFNLLTSVSGCHHWDSKNIFKTNHNYYQRFLPMPGGSNEAKWSLCATNRPLFTRERTRPQIHLFVLNVFLYLKVIALTNYHIMDSRGWTVNIFNVLLKKSHLHLGWHEG